MGENKNSLINIQRLLSRKFNVYTIDLFNLTCKFISKNDLELILKAIQQIKEKECITTNELLDKANRMFRGIKFHKTEKNIFKFIKENNLEVIDNNFIGFYTGAGFLYPKKTVDAVFDNLIKHMKEKVKLINISFEEYLSLSEKDFKKDYEILDIEKFKEIAGYSDNNKNKFRGIKVTFEATDVKVIRIALRDMYVSKKEFKEFMEFKNDYVESSYFKKFGIKFSNNMAKNNGISVVLYKTICYVKKEDIEKYLHIHNYNSEFKKSNNLYDRVKIKIKYYPNRNESNYPKFMEHFMEFIKFTSAKVRRFNYVAPLHNIYNVILDNIKKDLEQKNEKENNMLFNKVMKIVYENQHSKNIIIQFINYLREKKAFNLNKMVDKKEKGVKEPYKKEQFIKLLIKLIEIVADEDNLKKLYRNWNSSTVISYIFMHYCLAWRKMDLVSQLPKPNLKLFKGVTNGETFIEWLEDGNSISDKMANIICKDLEEETKRLRLKASKNKKELNCIIAPTLYKEVATLLCINEANRQIHCSKIKRSRYEDRVFNINYLQSRKMNKLLKENFDIDIEEILGGSFDNIRMNKGFLTLVKEKAEELNLAYSYYYTQVLRGHKSTRGALAETTKIYLQKDISKASVMAFATGTMGSVAYNLFQLVDKDFENKNKEEQIKAIQNLNMTPYAIERNVRIISNKISVMRSEIENFFKSGGYEEGFLKELLYGQSSYGIEEKTKCLLKITRKEELGIIRIKSRNYSEKNITTKWCPFSRKTCIGCEYMISLRYFIYEFERKFNEVLNDLEYSESETDKEIAIESINKLYIPVLNDLGVIFGDEVAKIIDTKRYLKLVETI